MVPTKLFSTSTISFSIFSCTFFASFVFANNSFATPPTVASPTATKAPTLNHKISKPKPGMLTLVRFDTGEKHEFMATRFGQLLPTALTRVARALRFRAPANLEHKVHPRLVKLLAKISDHFGGRPIEVISGYRPKRIGQYTPHSNHNKGHAIDMRIVGVPNEVLRDYCRTFSYVGVGYYPNSLFVHFDVRKDSAFWVDLSGPGERPNYVPVAAYFSEHKGKKTALSSSARTQPKEPNISEE